PRALFDTNFQEMDETTRAVFELSGNQFLFTRQDAPQPFSTPALHMITQKCGDFLAALGRGEFVLTTIESKGSLDDKINEVERAQKRIEEEIRELQGSTKDEEVKRFKAGYQSLVEHQIALDALYRVRAAFSH